MSEITKCDWCGCGYEKGAPDIYPWVIEYYGTEYSICSESCLAEAELALLAILDKTLL